MSLDRVIPAVSIALIALAIGPRAQEKQAPTFRTQIEAVSVDVSVLDNHRRPVTGLHAEDFRILIDGHPRPVIAFAAVDAVASKRRPAQLPPGLSVMNANSSAALIPEAASPGRIVAIVISRSRRDLAVAAREIARNVVEQLEPDDLGMVIFPERDGTSIATHDKTALLHQIEDAAVPLAMGEPGHSDPCRSAVFDAMSTYAEAVRDISTRRKVLLLVTPLLTITVQSPCSAAFAASRERLLRALRVSNVTVYTVDPSGLQTLAKDATVGTREGVQSNGRLDRTPVMRANLERQGNLLVLPDLTGGRWFMNTNRPEESVQIIFAETASYYVLCFQPDTAAKPGAHRVLITVSRQDARVIARTEWDARH